MKCIPPEIPAPAEQSLPVRGAWIEIPPSAQCGSRARSLPVRGAWIEMPSRSSPCTAPAPSLPVRGAWIEISPVCTASLFSRRRSPCGERGLKYRLSPFSICSTMSSLPVRGAWIEITSAARTLPNSCSRSPCGERGLKCPSGCIRSRSVPVAPRAGSVD